MRARSRAFRTILGLTVILGFISALSGSAATNTKDIGALVKGNNAFAFDLYATISRNQGNLFLSPYSISSALAMTYVGALGETAAQMTRTLHFHMASDRLHQSFSELNKTFNATGKSYRLSVANALWGQVGLKFKPEYLAITDKYYDAGFREVDYVNQNEQARLTINRWVEEKTENKIVELIKPKVLDELTRLVLTNAIYFKGQWEQKFKPENTDTAPFYLSNGDKIDVPFMNQTGRFRYAETADVQVLEMPYSGNELAMVIVLPRTVSGISKFEAGLKAAGFESLMAGLRPIRVEVSIPRFKFEKELSLARYLQELGMVDAFDERLANFYGMSDTFLYITHVIHKAFVEVNEEGTEAAAATAVVMGTKSVQLDETAVFSANRPFFFAIRDLRNDSILFVGRLSDPR